MWPMTTISSGRLRPGIVTSRFLNDFPRAVKLCVVTLLIPLPTAADIQSFLSRDAVRAVGVAKAMGYDGVSSQFYLALSRKLTNPAEVVLLAELAGTREA